MLIVDGAGRLVGSTAGAAARLGAPDGGLAPGALLAEVAARLPPGVRLRAAPLGNGLCAHLVEDEIGPGARAAAEIAMLRDTLDALEASVVVYDSAQRYRFGNRSYHELYPHLPDDSELVGETYAQLLARSIDAGVVRDPEAYADRDAFIARRVRQMTEHGADSHDMIGPQSDRTCQLRSHSTALGNRVALRVDTTELTELHRELLAAQKLEAIARISGKIAHEFNNLLTVMIGNLELLAQDPCGADSQALARSALAAAEAGARLTGQLLAAAPLPAPPAASRPAGAAAAGRRVVLLVDDDAEVRATTARLIAGFGHTLLLADGAEQALGLLASDAAIDLLFTDVVMPESRLNGLELAHAARRLRPGLAVVLTSGYSANALDGGIPPDVTVLAKPYRIAELAAALGGAGG